MALDWNNLSFSRQTLPVIALVGLVAAVIFILVGLPDRELSEPGREPPHAPANLAAEARVAGAGVVEPSSETIQIGSALSGTGGPLVLVPVLVPGPGLHPPPPPRYPPPQGCFLRDPQPLQLEFPDFPA